MTLKIASTRDPSDWNFYLPLFLTTLMNISTTVIIFVVHLSNLLVGPIFEKQEILHDNDQKHRLSHAFLMFSTNRKWPDMTGSHNRKLRIYSLNSAYSNWLENMSRSRALMFLKTGSTSGHDRKLKIWPKYLSYTNWWEKHFDWPLYGTNGHLWSNLDFPTDITGW